ncbi:hypothetical protein I1A62_22695 [Rhodococcus sp. USK10]|uniref:acyl-CoA dehydrogenase family protein n=1 Tax=Rhodococcus TaxID=1827 RepID=UPI000F577409|nr:MULTISPECIES: acyl-CoA dehydrogenase family protein [Rhodococcus]QYB07087.1 hypothetical protein I1A62_22695 [Rhodococcus sp. USK10]
MTEEVDPHIAESVQALLRSHSEGPGRYCDLPALLSQASRDGWFEVVDLGLSDSPDIGVRDALVACETFGRQAAPMSLVATAGFVVPLLTAIGTETPFAKQLSSWIAEGKIIGVPTTRVVFDSSRQDSLRFGLNDAVRADIADGVVRLHGRAEHTTDAAADVMLVSLEDNRIAAVPTQTDGVHMHPIQSIVPGLDVARVEFDGAAISDANIHHDDCIDAIHRAAIIWSLVLDAYSVGICRELVERSVEYACRRKQFGVPIGSFQAVQHLAANMHIAAETSAEMLAASARRWVEHSHRESAAVAASRLHSAASAVFAAESAVQLHGGVGFTWELGLHYWYRAAQFVRGYLTDEIRLREYLAHHIHAAADSSANGKER